MKKNEYKCGHCGGVFEQGWTDEEAKKEATDIFGKNPDDWNDGAVIVCDDCFQKMNPANYPDLVEKAKTLI